MVTPTSANGRHRLPRGPHRLSREEVERSQRDRLLAGAAEAVAEQGYAATSVADIHRRAGVSRATFYQLFEDKLDCFLAACRMASDVVSSTIADELADLASADDLAPLDKLDRVLGAYLQTLVDFPALARVFLVEVYAAGAEAIDARRASLEVFADLVASVLRAGVDGADAGEDGGSGGSVEGVDDARMVAEVMVAAVSSMVTNAVGVGDTDRLRDLQEPLMVVASRVLRQTG